MKKRYFINFQSFIIEFNLKLVSEETCGANKEYKLEYAKILSLPDFNIDYFEFSICKNEYNDVPHFTILLYDCMSGYHFTTDDITKTCKDNYFNPNILKFNFNTRSILIFNHKFIYFDPENPRWKKDMYGDVLLQFNRKGWKFFFKFFSRFYTR